MDDLNLEELSQQLEMEAIEDALKQLKITNPGAVFFFNMGRNLGKAEIVSKLIEIVNKESENAKIFADWLKGWKPNE